MNSPAPPVVGVLYPQHLRRTSSFRHLNPIVIVAFDINIAWSYRRIWYPVYGTIRGGPCRS
ncbi:hypothetical protein JMJ77_0005575 [Colletotrichum scovillei]|uniref:Uncharacterized protein n=1 Tax=Colletotrichum scovillei TaxID=1209932 RepID=A0A9P7UIV2_9PEZI|nr:hypothetical protein JMJ77_0005575 [Colletotrichum scovillei]KAG7076797.1 hypothetical protein JMJ76_0014056 [Colletotrichum scovillei]KAG7083799.1 hypothetical protein JMJ78_0009241 [Colletotrichum scovillei]